MKLTTRLVIAGATLSVAAVVIAQTTPPAPQNAAPRPTMQERVAANEAEFLNKPAKFSMKTLEDKTITNEDFKGKVVLIDFWATWCGPCKAAAPKLDAMHKELNEKGLVIIGANLAERGDAMGKKDNACAYVEEHKYGYTFTYANDAYGKEQKIIGYPTFYLVGKDGNLKSMFVGFNEAKIREAINAELAK